MSGRDLDPAAPAPPHAGQPGRYDAFIAYAREDRAIVERLARALAARDQEVWVDVEDIPGGADWRARVKRGIEACKAFVFVMSVDSVQSEHCRAELEQAHALNKLLIPVCHREVKESVLPVELTRREWIFLRAEDGFEEGVDRLVEALETDLDWRDRHTRLSGRAREWLDAGQDRSFLLHGSDLREAESWLAAQGDHRERATAEQTLYIAESRRIAKVRRRVTVAILSLLLTIAGVAGVLAVMESHQADSQRGRAEVQRRSALSRALATRAVGALSRDLDLAALLSLEAYRISATAEARNAVLDVLPDVERASGSLRGHTDSVNGLSVSSDGRTVASASADGTVRLWDLARRKQIGDPLGVSRFRLRDATFSPDGRSVAIATSTGALLLWDLATGKRRVLARRETSTVWDVEFSRDGKILAAAINGGVELFAVTSGRRMGRPLSGSNTAIFSLAISDGGTLVFANADGAIWTSDLGALPSKVTRVPAPRSEGPSIAISRDGDTLAIATGKAVQLWSLRRQRMIGTLESAGIVVAFSPSGETIAAASNQITLWDVRSRQRIGRPLNPHGGQTYAVTFTPDGATLVTGSENGAIRLWDLAGKRLLARPLKGISDHVNALSFSPDGRTIALAENHGSLGLWSVAGRRSVGVLEGHTSSVDDVAFSPDGTLLASGAGFGDTAIRLWDVATRKQAVALVGQTKEPDAGVGDVAFSADGTLLASAGTDGTAQLWDVAGGNPRGPSVKGHGETVSDVAFTPDGRQMISTWYDGTVRFWDTSRGRPNGASIAIDGVITAVAVSPDGKLLATTGDGVLQLWSLPGRRPVGQPLDASDGGRGAIAERVWDVAFSPDAQTLATAGGDGTVRLWDVEARRQIGEPQRVQRGEVTSVEFSPDGRRLASAATDGTVLIWDSALWSTNLEEFERRICAGVHRSLSRAEWNEYLPGIAYRRSCPPG